MFHVLNTTVAQAQTSEAQWKLQVWNVFNYVMERNKALEMDYQGSPVPLEDPGECEGPVVTYSNDLIIWFVQFRCGLQLFIF